MLGGDLINLKVKPEVSSLDFTNSIVLDGFRLPALTTRRADTEVELQDGQTFAIAGLMNNTLNSTMQKIPGIGDIPVLGLLFKSRAYQKNDTELVVMVTPTIVRRGSTGVSPACRRWSSRTCRGRRRRCRRRRPMLGRRAIQPNAPAPKGSQQPAPAPEPQPQAQRSPPGCATDPGIGRAAQRADARACAVEASDARRKGAGAEADDQGGGEGAEKQHEQKHEGRGGAVQKDAEAQKVAEKKAAEDKACRR